MNRKDFFKKLGLGAIVAFTAPKLLSEDLNCSEISNSSYDHLRPIADASRDAWNSYFAERDDYDKMLRRHYPFTYEECMLEADYQLHKAMNDEIIWKMSL